jgi:hypothetical protein
MRSTWSRVQDVQVRHDILTQSRRTSKYLTATPNRLRTPSPASVAACTPTLLQSSSRIIRTRPKLTPSASHSSATCPNTTVYGNTCGPNKRNPGPSKWTPYSSQQKPRITGSMGSNTSTQVTYDRPPSLSSRIANKLPGILKSQI